MTLDRQRPEILTPPEHPPACCTQHTITVPPSVTAKTAQKHDYPSKAHRRSYARRTAAERTFSTAKDPASNDISRGWCRLMGLTAITLFTATLRIVRNQRIMDAWDARQAPWGALYHVDSRRLSALLITPRAIAAASCLAEVFHEDRYAPWDSVIAEDATAALPVWLRQSPVRPTAPARDEDYVGRPATETQRRLRVRHRLMRRLLDDPVIYYDQLNAAEREFLTSITGWAVRRLSDVGFEVERRAEGWLLVDPDSIATDVTFPAGETGGNVKQAALLLLDALVAKARAVAAGPGLAAR